MDRVLLEVTDLSKHYIMKPSLLVAPRIVQAVSHVDFQVHEGETLALIGESGSGKTTLGHMLIGLLDADGGSIRFDGCDIATLHGEALRKQRQQMQMVFQYTYGALDPRRTTYDLIADALRVHRVPYEGEERQEVIRLLGLVGLGDGILEKTVRQISGGQRQRVGIARALATRPRMLVLDEPVSALDVSVQGQIINLLQDLKRDLGLTYLFITHDLKVARHLADRIAVMYRGEFVDVGETASILAGGTHPYTKELLKGVTIHGA